MLNRVLSTGFYLCFFCSVMHFFSARAFFSAASLLSRSSFDTLNTCRKALSNRSDSVLPGTCGAGNGLIVSTIARSLIRFLFTFRSFYVQYSPLFHNIHRENTRLINSLSPSGGIQFAVWKMMSAQYIDMSFHHYHEEAYSSLAIIASPSRGALTKQHKEPLSTSREEWTE
jgi:hypothetical protein